MKSKFWIGFWTYSCINSLIQDYHGKEKFLQMANERWIDSAITVPLAIVALIYLALSFIKD